METSSWDQRNESRHVDKSSWPPGAWHEEPDRIEWRFSGPPRLACLIVRGPSGALCGYVGVPPGHPLHGKDYSRCPDFDTHCGLTYAASCDEGGHICHAPQPGESPDVWWLGFDCAHAGDVCPAHLATDRAHGFREEYESYKDVRFVRGLVESLAAQLARVAKGLPPQEEN